MTEQHADPRPEPVVRVRFGPRPSQEMPAEWAEKGLCWLYEHRRQAFADMMLHVMDTGFLTRNTRSESNGSRS